VLEDPANTLTEEQAAIVRQARRDYDRRHQVARRVRAREGAQGSRGYHAWARRGRRTILRVTRRCWKKISSSPGARRRISGGVPRRTTTCSTSMTPV